MARVKGRSFYKQGPSRYEAFRPEEVEREPVKRETSTERLLNLFALGEKIGNSPISGVLIQGAQALSQAAEARAMAKAGATPETLQQQQEALKSPAEKVATPAAPTPTQPSAPATEMTSARMRVKPQTQVEERAAVSQKNIEEYRQRAGAEKLQYTPSDVAKVLQTSGLKNLSDDVFRRTLFIVADKQRREGGISIDDIESIAISVANNLPLPEEAMTAEMEAEKKVREQETQRRRLALETEAGRTMSREGQKEAFLQELKATNPRVQARVQKLLGDTAAVKARMDIARDQYAETLAGNPPVEDSEGMRKLDFLKQEYSLLEHYYELVTGEDAPDIIGNYERVKETPVEAPTPAPQFTDKEVQPSEMAFPGRKEPGVTIPTMPNIEQLVNNAIVEAVGKPTRQAAAPMEQAQRREAEPAPAMAPEAPVSPAVAPKPAEAPTTAPMVEEAIVARPVARNMTDLVSMAREATTPEKQREVLSMVEQVRLPPKNFFDYMFEGPQERARAEVMRAFPRITMVKGPTKTPEEIEADIEAKQALTKQRLASAGRTTAMTPVEVERVEAQAAKTQQEVDARVGNYNLPESLIKQRLRGPARRARPDQRPKLIREGAETERKQNEAEFKAIDGQATQATKNEESLQRSLEGKRSTIGSKPKPEKPDFGRRGALGKAEQKRQADYEKALKEYQEDQAEAKKIDKQIEDSKGRQKKAEAQKQKAIETRNRNLKAINDAEAEAMEEAGYGQRRAVREKTKAKKREAAQAPAQQTQTPPTQTGQSPENILAGEE